MDPDPFSVTLFKWDHHHHRPAPPPNRLLLQEATATVTPPPPQTPASFCRPKELGGLEDLFQQYGVRYFTVNTLVNMREEEIDEMMGSLGEIFRWELLMGERYGIKSAIRAERRRLEEEEARQRQQHHQHHQLLVVGGGGGEVNHHLDALSQEGLSEEPVQEEKEAAGSGGGGQWEASEGKKHRRRRATKGNVGGDAEEGSSGGERQREHPFIVTEPGEVARGKKNGLDYLFHLYDECRNFLIQVQALAKERGEKCPNKVTNQVFRHAKRAGASHINKPKMRHYVHCYALHCLDEEASNALRRAFKERGENVGAWRQACYHPLVAMSRHHHAWDVDALFASHPSLAIWYVPTKLRQLCHADRHSVTNTDGEAHVGAATTAHSHLHHHSIANC
ncbi:floricaula/leafy homolog [Amborella trichopoda]|uniref:Floricaula/leafy-like transcription factor n=1 Tax=Amborella trichopoda TaxID=13333 RepID=T2FGL3_AMBTC|nr:floricaula/leafy homolog [Amborella trichopoda]AGV98899.1 LEAFY-like protein [Amborella trichopoda]|eukprot:NP_001292752.1 floricaula/leafy homolog [Amborella trichopoda]